MDLSCQEDICFPKRGNLLLPSGTQLWEMRWHTSLSVEQAPCNHGPLECGHLGLLIYLFHLLASSGTEAHFPVHHWNHNLREGDIALQWYFWEIRGQVGVGKVINSKPKPKTKPKNFCLLVVPHHGGLKLGKTNVPVSKTSKLPHVRQLLEMPGSFLSWMAV